MKVFKNKKITNKTTESLSSGQNNSLQNIRKELNLEQNTKHNSQPREKRDGV
jgi:hypothetical protein